MAAERSSEHNIKIFSFKVYVGVFVTWSYWCQSLFKLSAWKNTLTIQIGSSCCSWSSWMKSLALWLLMLHCVHRLVSLLYLSWYRMKVYRPQCWGQHTAVWTSCRYQTLKQTRTPVNIREAARRVKKLTDDSQKWQEIKMYPTDFRDIPVAHKRNSNNSVHPLTFPPAPSSVQMCTC